MVVVNRIAPSEVIIVVGCVVDGAVIEIEIGVSVPGAPVVCRCIVLNHFDLGLSPIGGDLDVFYVELFAALCDDVEFHPPVFDVSSCGDFDPFRAVFRS